MTSPESLRPVQERSSFEYNKLVLSWLDDFALNVNPSFVYSMTPKSLSGEKNEEKIPESGRIWTCNHHELPCDLPLYHKDYKNFTYPNTLGLTTLVRSCSTSGRWVSWWPGATAMAPGSDLWSSSTSRQVLYALGPFWRITLLWNELG